MGNSCKTAQGLFLCLAFVLSCNSDTSPPSGDSSDASVDSFPDTAPDTPSDLPAETTPDAATVQSEIGRACFGDRNCEAGDTCINSSKSVEMPGGYCSRRCDPYAPFACSPPSICSNFLGVPMCMLTCTSDTDCRTGYACENLFVGYSPPDGEKLCVPGRRSAQLGDTCNGLFDCQPGNGICLQDLRDGYCSAFCDPLDTDSCRPSGNCIASDGDPLGGLCFQSCKNDNDCRDGKDYQCYDSKVCGPGNRNATLGQQCADSNDCQPQVGICLDQKHYAIPDGTCIHSCNPKSQDPCGPDGDCIVLTNSHSICVDRCTQNADCRDQYQCTTSFLGLPTSQTVCAPGQTSPVPIGHDCASTSNCSLGTQVCLSSTLSRTVPGGYCSSFCEPTNPKTKCPSDSVCVVSLWTDIGSCFAKCTTDAECQDKRSSESVGYYGCSIRLGTGVRFPNNVSACVAYNPKAKIGDGCVDGSDCGSGLGRCIFDNSPGSKPRFPNGYCTVDCNPYSVNNSCGPDAVCQNVNKGSSLGGSCVKLCKTDNECRRSEGYACLESISGALACLPQ